jgi:hypothetical protein
MAAEVVVIMEVTNNRQHPLLQASEGVPEYRVLPHQLIT